MTGGDNSEGEGWRNFYGRRSGKTLKPSQRAYLAEDLGPLVPKGVRREALCATADARGSLRARPRPRRNVREERGSRVSAEGLGFSALRRKSGRRSVSGRGVMM